jgi:hypothetical protein
MAGAIFGEKVSEAQSFRGFVAETWRDIAHGRRRNWALGEPAQNWMGGGVKAAWS